MGMFDAVIIGGGHNGLTCACYLARAGLRVRVLERRGVLGGAAVTEEFHPGFRNSTASYTVSLLHPKVIADLHLHDHGLRIVDRPFANFLPLSDAPGHHLKVGGGLAATAEAVARYSSRDAEALPRYYAMLDRVAAVLRDLLLETPPNVGGGVSDLLQAIRVGRRFRQLDMAARRDVLDLFTLSAGDLLDRWFESAPIKACFAFDSVVGNFASPYTPGSAYVLLHHVFGEVNGKPGTWGHAIGGMGSITTAMASEARALGVMLSLDKAVARVRVAGGRVLGVDCADGEVVEARRVVANVNPRLVFGSMIDPLIDLGDFGQRMRDYQCESATLRMNVALSELPSFSALPNAAGEAAPHHASGIIMAPSMDHMDAAYASARTKGISDAPIVELLIPSVVDDTLAPAGQHVASLFCQHFRYGGESQWTDAAREAAADRVIDTVCRYAPNFKSAVIARQVHTPLDLERKFGLVGGDIFHGKLTLNQLFSARPVLGHGNYRTPIRGLYLCGAGTHPGGGVTGIPGHNAAREVLRDGR
jgi:phytoene dehydrogenase-like protein